MLPSTAKNIRLNVSERERETERERDRDRKEINGGMESRANVI